jgi:hypothetical protein
MGMKTEDLPNGTSRVFEGAASEAEPAAAKARVAHTPPIDILGGRRPTLYSDGTPGVFDGALKQGVRFRNQIKRNLPTGQFRYSVPEMYRKQST